MQVIKNISSGYALIETTKNELEDVLQKSDRRIRRYYSKTWQN